jgi:large conductance mechanosensitive channel
MEAAVLKGFRDFIMRGNVVDLAVGIVIGAAFSGLVTQFVKSFIDPLVKLVSGGNSISGTFDLGGGVKMDWGGFVSAVITFLIVAAAIYFVVVLPINKLNELRRRGEVPEPETVSDEVRLLTEIRDALTNGGRRRPDRPERPETF